MSDQNKTKPDKAVKESKPAIEGDMSPEAKRKAKETASLGKKAIKYTLLAIVLIILAMGSFLWYVFYGPKWGTMHYGVCKVFAERYINFPTTMKVREVEYYGATARVYISHIDAAGQNNFNVVECQFTRGTLEITRVRIDRKTISELDVDEPVNPEILNNFNKGLNAILLNPPSLLIPHSRRNATLSELWQGD